MQSGEWFWDVYARVYDGIREAIPYQRLLARAVEAVPRGAGTLLDAGCGTGNLLASIRAERPALALHGIDFSAAMLRRARGRVPQATLIEGDLNGALPWSDASFDVVTCVNVLYAVADLDRTVAELLRVLRPGGVLIASSPMSAPRLGALVREHADVAGWARTGPLLMRLVGLLSLNLLILRRGRSGQYHFLSADRVRRLLGIEAVDAAYAGQNWFASLRKGETAPRFG